MRYNQGYQKLSWAAPIAYMSDVASGQGGPISYGQWAGAAFPTPQAVQRFPGDQFYRDACSSTVVYAGPTMNRAINFNEYQAAGSPSVRVDNPRNCGGSGGGSSPQPPTYQQGITPGAFCSPTGAFGYSAAGKLYQCKTSATDSRYRWRAA